MMDQSEWDLERQLIFLLLLSTILIFRNNEIDFMNLIFQQNDFFGKQNLTFKKMKKKYFCR